MKRILSTRSATVIYLDDLPKDGIYAQKNKSFGTIFVLVKFAENYYKFVPYFKPLSGNGSKAFNDVFSAIEETVQYYEIFHFNSIEELIREFGEK